MLTSQRRHFDRAFIELRDLLKGHDNHRQNCERNIYIRQEGSKNIETDHF